MSVERIVGRTLDDKYRIERELGRGGMGTVYLATHVGTERPVAVKVVAPQFMERPEFVERFRREARAAGRLRHPNVVNVTDFGFSETAEGRCAYLVMEYLDGCTLGEILEEEKNLPVGWTLDILEQICSAVHEAHEQGIIHRDLKPDNIWLEPNLRGGYTVKVLDFGIAKLEDQHTAGSPAEPRPSVAPMRESRKTSADNVYSLTLADAAADTRISEASTVIQAAEEMTGAGSAVLKPTAATDQEFVGTRLISEIGVESRPEFAPDGHTMMPEPTASDLTSAGAVLGTPLYMSPEQCRGEHLDPRSDVYSLGVIAYQMLSGATPFSGDFTRVMDAHRELSPPPLAARHVRKKLKRVIASALAKNPDERPRSAEAFGSILRSRSEGIFGLLRRALTIYTEHLPKFFGLALLLYIPYILAAFAGIAESIWDVDHAGTTEAFLLKIGFQLLSLGTGLFCANLIVGTTTWIVNQILSFPLRPVRIKPALAATRKRWKPLVGTGVLATLVVFAGFALLFVPGLVLSVVLALVSPVVMMENLRGIQAMKRSKMLVTRSLRTTTAAVAILFFVPAFFAAGAGYVAAVSVRAFSTGEIGSAESRRRTAVSQSESELSVGSAAVEMDGEAPTKAETRAERVRDAVRGALTTLIMLPFQIILGSLSSIVVALLYLKTRQAGGESLSDLIEQFEETDRPRTKWQARVRQRLIESGRGFRGHDFTN